MKTQITITITHPDEFSAESFVAETIRPYIADCNADSADGWSLEVEAVSTEEELRDKAMRTALSLILSEYPEDLEAHWVIDGVLTNDYRVLVWEPFAYFDREDLVDQIEGFAHIIYHTYFK